MDFKKLACGATTIYNRAIQITGETLGQSEKTQYDENFVALLEKCDKIKLWVEKIIKDMEAFLQPNQAARLEDFVSDKLQAFKSNRPHELETLAQTMADASNDLGSTTAFGEILSKCGAAEATVAEAWKAFVAKVVSEFLAPMKNFLDTNIATITKEKKVLETKRLDLDSAKSKHKKITAPGKDPDANTLLKVEEEMKAAQAEFDKHVESTQQLLEEVSSSQADHVKHLSAFQAAQLEYYTKCAEATKNIDSK